MGGTHSHGPDDPSTATALSHRRRLGLAFALTAAVVVAQAIGSVITGSLALLTDTVHALTDSIGLLVALVASALILRPPTPERTWGHRRLEVIAALGQALLLVGIGVYAAIEGVRRLVDPPEVAGGELLVFGIVGLAANIAAISILASTRRANLNMRAAFLEVLADALGSLGVIVAAVVITTTGFQRADAIAGLVIAALIVPRAVVLMREALSVLMEHTPRQLDLGQVRAHLREIEHVVDVHDLHASTIATGLPTLSAHLVLDDGCFADGHAPRILAQARECVAEHFGMSVHHVTLQLETRETSADERGAHA